MQKEAVKPDSDDMGIWVFVLGDMLLFSIIFGSYAFDRSQQHALYYQSQQLLNDSLAAANTLLLLTGSLFVVLALHIARQGQSPWVVRLIQLTICTGILFLVNKIVEYTENVHAGYTLLTNDFYSYYYMMTGVHLLHVVVGTSVLVYVASRLKQSPENLTLLRNGGVIWHMVDLLWIVLFPLLYLVK